MTRHIIDPTQFNVNTTNTAQLKTIFSQMIKYSDTYFVNRGNYQMEVKGNIISLKLTHDILIRPRKDNREGIRIEILDSEPFFEAKNSEIHESLGVIIPENDYQFKEKSYYKTRICKYISMDSVALPLEITNEAEYTKLNKKLHCKTAMLDEDFGYIVMRRVREEDILEIINKIEDGEINLTIEQRVKIVYKILN
jgi:hypothetical protein